MTKFKDAQDIKVGVVGYGGAFSMGRIHLDEMGRAGMTPIAIVEVDPERLATAGNDYPGIETYNTVAEMLKKSKVDLVTIITPHNTHVKLALQCLRAGRHVVCEKPLAITTAECDAMIKVAEKQGLMINTYHNRHWDGRIMRAVQQIRKGTIGDVYRVEAHMGAFGQPRDWWRSSKSISGGILYDWGVHLLEYTLQVVDSDIVEVAGFAKNGFWAGKTQWKDDTNEDEGFLVVRFASGVWSTLCVTQLDSNPKRYDVEISGTKGTYLFDPASGELRTRDRRGNEVITRGKNPDGQSWRFYQNIADHLSKKEPLVITAQWARRPIHILDLACRSAKTHQAIKARYR